MVLDAMRTVMCRLRQYETIYRHRRRKYNENNELKKVENEERVYKIKSTIYRLFCKDPNITDCYIGSTCDYKQRKRQHKSDCTNENSKRYNFKVYQFIRQNEGWQNWAFEVLEQFECNMKQERLERELHYIKLNNATLNSDVPGRTMKQYCKDYKEKRLKRAKQYQNDHRDKILKRAKQKYNCKCGGKYTHGSKARHLRLNKHQKWYRTTYEYLKQRSAELDQLGLELDLKAQKYL
jgi:hypothetical protein